MITNEVSAMKLSQYIYGRKPKAGLQVITRSRELPFFVQSWFESPRYGAAPTRSTPERIWACRYELQCFEGGAAISCLYPLKQTEVPCREQQEPYIRGITPAVQHLLAGAEDTDVLIANVSAALHFDGFHDIDEIYRLPSSFSEPVDFTPAPTAPAALSDAEKAMCVDMAACLWKAFMSRKNNKTGELAQNAVKLIVPAGTPESELAHQRRLAAAALDLLPAYIRRWASLTLGMEVESDAYPGGSAFYGMARASADTMPTGKGKLFDAEKMQWDPKCISAEERGYFMARQAGQAVTLLDEAVSRLPVRFDLAFHVALQNTLHQLCRGCISADDLRRLIADAKLKDHTDLLCTALANAVIAACQQHMDRKPLTGLWVLAEVSAQSADRLGSVQCSADEALAVLVRDGVSIETKELCRADEHFARFILRLSSFDQTPLSDASVHDLRLWLGGITEYVLFVENLVNGLLQHGKLVISNSSMLTTWLENSIVLRMKELAKADSFISLLNEAGAAKLSDILLAAAEQNQAIEWTTGAEKLLIEWFNANAQLPAWHDDALLKAARRVLSLRDKTGLWPVFAVRCADAPERGSEALVQLFRDPVIRTLAPLQPIRQKYAFFLLNRSVNDLCAAVTKPADTLRLAALWKDITNGEPFQMNPEHWYQLHDTVLRALNRQKLSELIHFYHEIRKQDIPQECFEQMVHAAAKQSLLVLPGEDLRERPWEDLMLVLDFADHYQNDVPVASHHALSMIWDLKTICESTQPQIDFAQVRSNMQQLTQPERDMFQGLLQIHANSRQNGKPLATSVLLQSIRSGNTMDWANALPRIMKNYDLPEVQPDDMAKASVEDYELFLSLLCGLYQQHPAAAFGMLLSPYDRQLLSEWFHAACPKLFKRLQTEQKKHGDLPPELVNGLQLYSGKR